MRKHLAVALMAGACAAWMATPLAAQATSGSQSGAGANPAPCSVAPEPQPCGTTPTAPSGKPSAAEKFPFPGETSPSSGDSTAPSLNGLPPSSAPATKNDAAKKFPFPGDDADTPSAPAAGSSSSSSSSSSSGDATPDDAGDTPALTDKGSEGSTAAPGGHILHRVSPKAAKAPTLEERLQEDIDVAHFYLDSGDLQGAYLRGQDAIKIAPDDPEAHFTLAEIALKLNKKDEAIAEYNACLKLDPTDKEAKDARRALAKLK